VASALSTRGLVKRYGRKVALDGVDLEIAEGQMFGLLGPNGAGKSTLMKIVTGLVRPGDGKAEVAGLAAGSLEARRRIGYLSETFRGPPWATAEEWLKLHQELIGSDGGASERSELLRRVGLDGVEGLRIGSMSKGMAQRLGLAQALAGSPRLLILDEPTSALDPAGRRLVRELLQELGGAGTTILVSSHLLSEVERVCDRVAILKAGKVIAEGRPSELAKPRGVEIETAAGTVRHEDATREEVPALVAGLIEAGERIYAVRPLGTGLEDTYLDALGEEPSG
jgi:ABC-2 type transport system ATP-binding protein